MAVTKANGIWEPPRRIAGYEVVRELGRGAMGAVFLARHGRSGGLRALKLVMVPELVAVQGIRREICALTRLRHPGIVAVVDEGEAQGIPWYAMEHVAGQTLGAACEALRRAAGATEKASSAAGLERVLGLVRRICWSLAYMHGEGVVHGDLKPGNILVAEGDRPVLVDFGMARWLQRGGAGTTSTSRETLEVRKPGGSLAYMAPEVLQHTHVDARADLYSLGCIIFALLAGRPPFVGSRSHIARTQVHDPPPRLSAAVRDIPSRLDDLVAAMLEKRPRARIGYADLVADELEKIGAPAAPWIGAPPARLYLYRPRFHGRSRELLELMARVDAALGGGAGGLALVQGESGIGKTKLLTELGRRADRRGMLVVTEECESGQERPLQIMRKLLTTLCDRCRALGPTLSKCVFGARGKVLAQLEPAIAALPGQDLLPEPVELGPEESRLRLFSYLAGTLRAFAFQERLLLLVDDLQAADELSLGFLLFLARGRHLLDPPIVIVAASRTEEHRPELGALAAAAATSPLELGRLDGDAVRRIISDMLALAAPAHALAARMMQHSEGNPLFVSEYLYAAVGDGVLGRDQRGAWTLGGQAVGDARLETLPLPATLRELLDHRFMALSEASRALLEAMSVIGRESQAPLAELVSTLRGRAFQAAVRELVERRILEDLGATNVLRFGHDKIREAAYGRLGENEKRRLHLAVASALAASSETNPPVGSSDTFARDSALARHWELAGKPVAARACYARAGRVAANAFANGEATRLFKRCLALFAEPSAERIEVQYQLTEVLRRTGKLVEAAENQRTALSEAAAVGADHLVVAGLRTHALLCLALGDTEGAMQSFARGIRLARHRGDPRSESSLLTGLGSVLSRRHRPGGALRCHRRALELARTCGDAATQGIALMSLGSLAQSAGQFRSTRRSFEKLVAVARSSGDRHLELMAQMNLGVVLSETGDPHGALLLFSTSLGIAREMGDRNKELTILNNLGASSERIQDLVAAQSHYEASLRIATEIGDRWVVAVVAFNLGAVCLRSGDLVAGRRNLDAAIDEARRLPDAWIEAMATTALVGAARRQGEPTAALLGRIDGAIASLERLGKRREVVEALCEKGHLLLAASNSAAGVLARIEELARDGEDPVGGRDHAAVAELRRAQEAFLFGEARAFPDGARTCP
ncbi:MAG: tetratricopeptide repeat protein [Candidatus Schekmanbacteria bacterium]|nr:tetratricopeptide repeat protein [Candidatus Schekmanbacteria bacterium]